MELKIVTKDNGLTVVVTDEHGNKIDNIKKISIQPFLPGGEFITANIELNVQELDIECIQDT